MRSLSKEAERKLIGAIEKAAEMVNNGMTPTDAIIKSAKDNEVPAGHINLMVHAYNTGRTTTQREKGESTLEKAAEFPLADVNDVLKALYPETVKSSSAIRRAEAVSTEYALPVAGMLARRRDEMQKAAAATVALPEKTWTPPPRDEHAAVMRAQSQKMAAKRAEEETRRQATAAYGKAAASLDELNVYFRTPGNMSFGDALREVNLRFGPQGVSVLEKVAAVYPHFKKQADTRQSHFGDNAVYGLVQNVLNTVSAYNDAQAKVSVKKSEAVSKKTAPEFLTGSILAETVEEPLLLKDAATEFASFGGKKLSPTLPKEIIKTDGQPESAWTPSVEAGLPNAVENALATPRSSRNPRDTIGAAALRADMARDNDTGPDYENEIAQNEGIGSNFDIEPLLQAANQRQVHEDKEYARIRQEHDNAEKRKKEEAAERQQIADEEYMRVQREHADAEQRKQDAELRQKAERNRAEEDEHKKDTEIRDKWRAGLEKQKEEQTKQRQETWNKGKSIGENVGKAFKGNFMENATTPIKTIGGLLGAKTLADISPVQKKDPKNVLREQYQKLTDPSHENALKTIRAKSILHDMVLNDPVISGYDPQDVAMAFNEIAELAPSLVDAPGMVRPLLRKRLESGQLADFDVKQILEMDKLRADRDKSLADIKEKNLNLL